MDNASLLYEEIKNYTDIQKLIGTHEDIFIDFKEAQEPRFGKMRDGDKAHYSIAASGFAHQEGGVLVWGVKARKDENDVNCAVELKPINNVKTFLSDLYEYVKYSTEPVVDGIQHKVIYENDDEAGNKGFAVSFFPKSDREHRALGRTTSDFYKRYGDSFVPLGTADTKSLFLRSLSPDLELSVVRYNEGSDKAVLRFFVKNNGRGVARNCSAYFGLKENMEVNWQPGDGSTHFRIAQLSRMFPMHPQTMLVKLNPGVIIHPNEEMIIALASCSKSGLNAQTIGVEYKIFSENMIPKEGYIEV